MDILNVIPENGLNFNYRGTPVDPEIRTVWRVSLICIVLLNLCRGNKASVKKVQVLSSLLSSKRKMDLYLNRSGNGFLNLRFDPFVDRAINIGIGYNVFELDAAKNIKLTALGLAYAGEIFLDSEVFSLEKEFVEKFNKNHFSDNRIDRLVSGGI